MGKEINIKLEVNSIIEFEMSEKERLELVDHILYCCTCDKSFTQFAKKFIDGIAEVQLGDKQRKDVVKACKIINRSL